MFVLHKLKQKKPLKIKKINNSHSIEIENENFIQYATETPTFDKLSLFESDRPDRLENAKYLGNCAFFDLSTRIKDEKMKDIDAVTYEELQVLHGSKRSQKAVKSREQTQNNLNIDNIHLEKFTGDEQILPNFDENAEKTRDIYKTSIMFNEYLLEQIREYDVVVCNLKVAPHEYNSTMKVYFVILDTILYILKRKYIPDKLPHANLSYDILNEILTQKEDVDYLEYNKVRNYNQLERMKFIAMAYIMMLKIRKNKLSLLSVPNFHLSESDVKKIFRLIGCKIDQDQVSLVKPPELKVRVRKRNRRQ